MAERRVSTGPAPLIVAHRGDPTRHPENSLAGLRSAFDAGADAVEFDVRLTADGFPIVIHDADVGRTTEGSGAVHEMTLDELRRLRLRDATDERLPTLREALEVAAERRGGVDVEIKNVPGDPAYEPDGERALEATLRELAREDVGFVLISSFNPSTLRRSRQLAPDIPTGLLIVDAVDPRAALEAARIDGHTYLLPSVPALDAAGRGLVAEAHEARVRVGTWNADEPATVRRLLEWNVDAVATNDPWMAAATRDAWRRERRGGRAASP
jgi:glycerophosphoryl diester phosphodiesterase